MDIITLIEEIQESLFEFDLKTGMRQFESFTEELILNSGKLNQSDLTEFYSILSAVNSSLINKDYLLFCDLLEYELKPFINNQVESME